MKASTGLIEEEATIQVGQLADHLKPFLAELMVRKAKQLGIPIQSLDVELPLKTANRIRLFLGEKKRPITKLGKYTLRDLLLELHRHHIDYFMALACIGRIELLPNGTITFRNAKKLWAFCRCKLGNVYEVTPLPKCDLGHYKPKVVVYVRCIKCSAILPIIRREKSICSTCREISSEKMPEKTLKVILPEQPQRKKWRPREPDPPAPDGLIVKARIRKCTMCDARTVAGSNYCYHCGLKS